MVFLDQHTQIVSNKFGPKIKIRKFGTKIVLTGYFGLESQKANVEFEISIFEFVNKQSFIQKRKIFKIGSKKLPYLGIFGLQFNKNYYQTLNQHIRICETIKFHPKRKKITLGPKMLCLGLSMEY